MGRTDVITRPVESTVIDKPPGIKHVIDKPPGIKQWTFLTPQFPVLVALPYVAPHLKSTIEARGGELSLTVRR